MTAALSNPIFRALTGAHKELALREGAMLRYPPDVLPFAAVAEAGTELAADVVLEHGTVFFCDVHPVLPKTEVVTALFPVAQMVFQGPIETPSSRNDEVELQRADDADMLALTDVAFPGMFRIHSGHLGRFLGIRQEGVLAAMVGERFRFDGWREISAVCTRPGFTGRGFAAYLIQRLLQTGTGRPFLHVATSNDRAFALYQRLGFVHTATVSVMKVDRRSESI